MKTPLEEREQEQFNDAFIELVLGHEEPMDFGGDLLTYDQIMERCRVYVPPARIEKQVVTEDQMALIMSGQLTPEQIQEITGT
jgi:hypothetical protein